MQIIELSSIKSITESRMLSPKGHQGIMESLQPYSTIWYSRGWTFQELIFSRQKIMFQYQMAVWECACGAWHEGTPISEILSENTLYAPIVGSGRLVSQPQPQVPLPQTSTSQLGSRTPVEIKPNLGWPDLQRYMNLVRNYNDRLLTCLEDIIAGFSGVLTTLSGVFISEFISGLLEMFFDIALLLQPASPLERRVSSSEASRLSLPSWSWAGWRGDIDQRSWASGYLQMRSYSAFLHKMWPMCRWSCGSGTTWRKLDITRYKHLNDRSQYIIKSKELPHGWSMSLHDDDKSSFSHTRYLWSSFTIP
jgi:hypothetical protein